MRQRAISPYREAPPVSLKNRVPLWVSLWMGDMCEVVKQSGKKPSKEQIEWHKRAKAVSYETRLTEVTQ